MSSRQSPVGASPSPPPMRGHGLPRSHGPAEEELAAKGLTCGYRLDAPDSCRRSPGRWLSARSRRCSTRRSGLDPATTLQQGPALRVRSSSGSGPGAVPCTAIADRPSTDKRYVPFASVLRLSRSSGMNARRVRGTVLQCDRPGGRADCKLPSGTKHMHAPVLVEPFGAKHLQALSWSSRLAPSICKHPSWSSRLAPSICKQRS
jgi:hypothetical protein